MTSADYCVRVTETTDLYKATEIAKKSIGYGLTSYFSCHRGLFVDYWLCRISMIFDETNNEDGRRAEEIGNDLLELAGEIALRSGEKIDNIFRLNVV